MARVIGVFSGKGGVGKTTVTANIGATLAHDFNKKVISIDTNTSSAGLSLHLGMQFYPITLNQILKGKANISDAIEVHPSGLGVIPASLNLGDAFIDHDKLPRVIEKLRSYADIILLDTAPALGERTLDTMKACDQALIVTNPDLPAAVEALKAVKLAKKHALEILGTVVNKVGNGTSLSLDEVEYICNIPVIASIPEEKAVTKSIEKHMPLVHYKPQSKAAQDFKALAADLIGERYERRVGLFEKLKSFIS